MMALRNSGIGLVILLVLQALWLEPARPELPGGGATDAEALKQEAVYQSRGEQVPDGYVIDRSLLSYASILPSGFDRSLAELGPGDRWLDIGAGRGRAILDYYAPRYDAMHPAGRERRGKKARAVAISIEDRRTAGWHEAAASLEAGQIQYLFGRRLREYSREELGQFKLITDLTGGFSYTRDLSLFVEKVLDFLEVGGNFYTLLLDVHPENAAGRPLYPDLLYLTEIRNAGGAEVGVCSWLKRIRCVEITCVPDADLKRPVELYRVRKVCNDVSVPPLVPVQFTAGTPPQRRFRVTSDE